MVTERARWLRLAIHRTDVWHSEVQTLYGQLGGCLPAISTARGGSVIAAVEAIRAISRAALGRETKTNLASPGSNLGQSRIFFNFNPPALVIRQVPVKSIQV